MAKLATNSNSTTEINFELFQLKDLLKLLTQCHGSVVPLAMFLISLKQYFSVQNLHVGCHWFIGSGNPAFLGSICQYSNIDEKGRGEGGCLSKNLRRMFCKFQKQGNGFPGAVLDLAY